MEHPNNSISLINFSPEGTRRVDASQRAPKSPKPVDLGSGGCGVLRRSPQPYRRERRGQGGKAGKGVLFLLYARQVVDNGEYSLPDDRFRALIGTSQFPIRWVDVVRQFDDRVEPFSPNGHFPGAVRGNCPRTING